MMYPCKVILNLINKPELILHENYTILRIQKEAALGLHKTIN
jgi:hypothetical protein